MSVESDDRVGEFGNRPVIGNHDVGSCESIGTAHLVVDPCPGIVFGEASVSNQSTNGGFWVGVDDDQEFEIVSSGLDEQRNIQNDYSTGVALDLDAAIDLVADHRVHDGVQQGELCGIGEHTGGESRTVEGAIRSQNLLAKGRNDRCERRLTGGLHLSRDHVGVDDLVPVATKQFRDGALPTADSTGEPNQMHGAPRYRSERRRPDEDHR